MLVVVAGLTCVVGFLLLAKSADHFVVGAARLAAMLQISPVVIGAIVIGFGTSAPEMFVSGLSASQGETELGIGNVIGSNIANLTLVLGVAALIIPIHTSSKTLRREAPLSTASVLLFGLLVQDGLTQVEGGALVVVLAIVLGYIIRDARVTSDTELVGEVREYVGDQEHRLSGEALRTIVGLVGTLVGAQALVWGATEIADELGVDQGFVGLTLVAIGTSLPELVTAVQAARRREDELIIGNLLGSNIFNSLAVGGLIGLLGRGPLDEPGLVAWSSLLMVAVATTAWAFMATRHRVERWEAISLLVVYAVAVPLMAL